MKKGRGKGKGSAFERKVCKALSLWVTHGKKEDCFWRSAMSGGRATVAAKKGKELARQAGDITAVAPEGNALTNQFYIECKHYKDLALDSFLIKQTGTLAKFWVKTRKEANRYGKRPLLIAKQNNMPTLVIVNLGDLGVIFEKGPMEIVVQRRLQFKVLHFDELMQWRFRP